MREHDKTPRTWSVRPHHWLLALVLLILLLIWVLPAAASPSRSVSAMAAPDPWHSPMLRSADR